MLSFGAGAIAVMVIGGVVGALVGGVTGEAAAIAAISLGAIAIVSLVFLEVGLSEDREREREAGERRRIPPVPGSKGRAPRRCAPPARRPS